MKVYIGWSGEDALAYEVCRASLLAQASIPVTIIPLKHWELRKRDLYSRPFMVTGQGQRLDGIDGTPHSTDFSFTRFLVPALDYYQPHWSLYCDADMLWLDDIAILSRELRGKSGAAAVVKHPEYTPSLTVKMTGVVQSRYPKKNWSSLIAFHGERCAGHLTKTHVNTMPGSFLHQFKWIHESAVCSLPARWNMLQGEQEVIDPGVVHFTNGTPDMDHHSDPDKWSKLWLECAAALSTGGIDRVRGVILDNGND